MELALVAALLVATWHRTPLELAAYAWWAGLGVILSFVDLQVRRLPDPLTTGCAAGLLVGLLVPTIAEQQAGAWLRALLAGLVLAASLGLLALARPAALGWGDAKAAVAVGAALGWIGWFAVYIGVLLAFLLASGYALTQLARRRIRRRDALPLGPFLFAGAAIASAVMG